MGDKHKDDRRYLFNLLFENAMEAEHGCLCVWCSIFSDHKQIRNLWKTNTRIPLH